MYPPRIVTSGKMSWNEYRAVHAWIKGILGKPSLCDECGTTKVRTYHWANISHNYLKDVSDWKRLCVPCHALFDLDRDKTRCIRGHDMTASNTYTHPNGSLLCRLCKRALDREALRRFRARNKVTAPTN